ncbi:MAG: Asp-tRNA(Asn)/Glu-tRNA(Gln) amidotransferase subunit GatC [Planctomycetes bacterium]|nr:Asp-tRNA(Asn)/Glu-tRNA(Gln) amidotransferase subunit GatC [Planctomycetota bacterium]
MSHTLTDEQVRHVARLARLKLADDQVHYFAQQLSAVLGYVDKLAELDVQNVEPMAHPSAITNRFRDDVPTQPLSNEAVLANAPDADPPFFKVPKVLGDGGGA